MVTRRVRKSLQTAATSASSRTKSSKPPAGILSDRLVLGLAAAGLLACVLFAFYPHNDGSPAPPHVVGDERNTARGHAHHKNGRQETPTSGMEATRPTSARLPRDEIERLLSKAELAEREHRYEAAALIYQQLLPLHTMEALDQDDQVKLLDRAALTKRKMRQHDEAFELHYQVRLLVGEHCGPGLCICSRDTVACTTYFAT